ncbi:MAG: helix-turn-helix domain-containing protein [Marinoscillum sp.]
MQNQENALSIAVLPFRNISQEADNDYFCDGMSEEIIIALSRVQGLKVISRTSSFYFKNTQVPIKEIGSKLDVSNILEGSVRLAGDKMRISAQLINVSDESNFWSETWERGVDDLFQIQDEISLLIADKLREFGGHLEISDHLVNSPTKSISAYEHYLKGRFHFFQWNPKDTHLAIEHFHQTVAIDDQLVDGYLGLADSYSFMAVAGFAPREEAWMKAIEAIESAKKLDPNHAGLNYMLGHQSFFVEADFAGAMQYELKSVAVKPNNPEALQFLSSLYVFQGDFKKSKEYILYAKSLDPLNPETRFFEANYLYRSGDYQGAEEILNDLLEANSKNLPAIIVSLYIQVLTNRLDGAKASLERIPDELMTPDELLGLKCLVEISSGHTDTPLLEELEQHAKEPTAHHAHSYLFIAYARLGENDKAFQELEKLFEYRSSILLLGFSDPMAQKIFTDPRYSEYHQKVYPKKAIKPAPKRKSTRPLENDKAEVLVDKIRHYFLDERPYLNPALTLRILADQVDIHPNTLSWLINEHICKNFNEFINEYRIEHFKKLVVDPSNSHISLIGLAYESGFNSKTVFNTAFKKTVGMTPKAFQKSQS